jgi:hypothetical protein
VSTRQGVRIAFELNAEELCLRFIVNPCQVVSLHSEPRARISILFSYILCDVLLIIGYRKFKDIGNLLHLPAH